MSREQAVTLEDEPFGCCIAHRLVLRRWVDLDEDRADVGCAEGCNVETESVVWA